MAEHSCKKRISRWLSVRLVCTIAMLLGVIHSATGNPLVQYNPIGPQTASTLLPPSFVDPSIIGSNLTEVGFDVFDNTHVLPVGFISTSPTINLSQYITFTIEGKDGLSIQLETLIYDKLSYRNHGARNASVRSSLDSFSSDIASLTVDPSGTQSLSFNLRGLALIVGPVTFRIYFYNAAGPDDWDDLVSTASGGNGLRVNGTFTTPSRALIDQPDDIAGPQIHVMYVLPSDGADAQLDLDGAIAVSVAAFQKWLAGQTGGRRLRLDTYQGALDITFHRLTRTDADIRAFGAFVRDQVEAELHAAGFNQPNKLYAVYYGGSSTFACGGGAWPPDLPGNVAALYLFGTPPNAAPCATNPFASSEDRPGYKEFAMLHELLHTMGFVATCAPHETLRGHVSNDPRDLMYAGPLPWQPSILDVGHDDYFNVPNSNCLDLAKSAFLDQFDLNLNLNQTTFTLNDTIILTLAGLPYFAGDLYLVVLLPDHSEFAFDGHNWLFIFDGVRLFPSALQAFRRNTTLTSSRQIIFNATITGPIPPGTYTFFAFLVNAAADPLNTSNWLSNLAQVSFVFGGG